MKVMMFIDSAFLVEFGRFLGAFYSLKFRVGFKSFV